MTVDREVLFVSPWCRFVAEPQPAGDPYYMLEIPDYVSVVARTSLGALVLVRQHRPVVGRQTIELPSGHVDGGETPEQAARRELLEETGMVTDTMELLGVLVPDVGRLSNRMWCYFAPDVRQTAAARPEEGIHVLDVPEAEALTMALDGRIEHALTLAALFLAAGKRRIALE